MSRLLLALCVFACVGVIHSFIKAPRLQAPTKWVTRACTASRSRSSVSVLFSSVVVEPGQTKVVGSSSSGNGGSRTSSPRTALTAEQIATIDKKDKTKLFAGSVVSVHEFGAFVEMEAFPGVQGLVPQSMLPRGEAKPKVGAKVQVSIQDVSEDGKKLVLKMKSSSSSSSGGNGALAGIPNTRWVQGIVQSVTSFGLFVRPAGVDQTGLVHNSRVPRDLIRILKERSPITNNSNKTDVECLFSQGDVVKVRINSVASDSDRVELSMLPYRASDDEEDDYVVEGRDPEEEEGGGRYQDDVSEEEDDGMSYDAEDTLLWWKGEPYIKSMLSNAAVVDEEEEVIMENSAVVEGTWRRLFEVDLREDQADFSTKIKEAEMKELEEEIGELNGLDDDMVDVGAVLGSAYTPGAFNLMSSRLGSFVSTSSVPIEWKDALDIFKQADLATESKYNLLRKGKASEQIEFEAILREVEVDSSSPSSPGAPRRSEDVSASLTVEPAEMQEESTSTADAPVEV